MRRVLAFLLVVLALPAGAAAQATHVPGQLILDAGPVRLLAGSGDPEASVTAPAGSIYLRTNGGVYRKGSGSGNTGWLNLAPQSTEPSTSPTYTGITFSAALPFVRWVETDQSADLTTWQMPVNAGSLFLQTANDALSATVNLLEIVRSTGAWTIDAVANGATMTIRDASDGTVFQINTSTHLTSAASGAWGTGANGGSGLAAGRNSSGSGAAGFVIFVERDGTGGYVWADDSGLLRIGTNRPTEDNTTVSDTSGTIIGTQSSRAATKDIHGQATDAAAALQLLLDTPVFDFTYHNGAYGGQAFRGIVTDFSPAFGMDAGADGVMRSFNPVSAFGTAVLAIQALEAEIAALRAQVVRLSGGSR